jgi:large subunit ribosomal protein L21
MSFIVQSGSKQYVVDYGQQIIVDRLAAGEGETVELQLVHSFGDGKEPKKLQAKVVKHQRGPKIRVVKYKAKSNYHRQYGFRPEQTLLEIVK